MKLLQVSGLEAGYRHSQVLFGIDFSVAAGQVVTLLGRNGMGKSTTVKCLSGLLKPSAGTIELAGLALAGQPAYRIGRAGVGLVPEGRQVFPTLTVRENLVATASQRNAGANPWTLARVFELFPRLAERERQLGGRLSGGEQQMLAIGRALMTNPRLLILDEATEGLAPLVRAEIYQAVENLKAAGQSILIIDKDVKALTRIADRHTILEKGRVVWSGDSAALAASEDVQHRYLGV